MPGWLERSPHLPAGYGLATLDTVDSTNAEALRRAAAAEAGPVWICAGEQTAGRGRRSRSWSSPRGNLHATLLLTVTGSAARLTEYGILAGLAAHDTVAGFLDGSGHAVALKWPNDLLVDGKKVSGLLLESTGLGAAGPWSLAVGIGINLSSHPEAAAWPAGNLADFGAAVSPVEALEQLAERMDHWLGVWRRGGMDDLRAEWAGRMSGVGGQVTVNLNGESLSGRFAALDGDGALLLELDDGSCRRIMAGDVFLPPAGGAVREAPTDGR